MPRREALARLRGLYRNAPFGVEGFASAVESALPNLLPCFKAREPWTDDSAHDAEVDLRNGPSHRSRLANPNIARRCVPSTKPVACLIACRLDQCHIGVAPREAWKAERVCSHPIPPSWRAVTQAGRSTRPLGVPRKGVRYRVGKERLHSTSSNGFLSHKSQPTGAP